MTVDSDEDDPDPGGTLFLGRNWYFARFNFVAACVAPFWPIEHRFFDFYRTVHTGGFGGRNVDEFSWYLRSPVPGVSVARLLRWIEIELKERESTLVREAVSRALTQPDPTWPAGSWGVWPSVRTGPPRPPEFEEGYSVRQQSANRLEVVVPTGNGEDHSIQIDEAGRTATDHRSLRTSRGVGESVCPACHRAMVVLEVLKRSPVPDVPDWLRLRAPAPELSEWFAKITSPTDAAEFRHEGIGPRVASLFVDQNITAAAARQWLDAGVEPSLAAGLTQLGLDPDSFAVAAASAAGFWWIRDLKWSLSGRP